MPKERVSFLGSYFPFATIRYSAEEAGDFRAPIEERYKSREEYLEKFSEAARKLAADRFLLGEDIDALVQRGGSEWDFVTK
jgi:hypothetical protein